MKALNAFKQYGLKMLAVVGMTALSAVSNDVQAQTKPIVNKDSTTTIKKPVIKTDEKGRPVYEYKGKTTTVKTDTLQGSKKVVPVVQQPKKVTPKVTPPKKTPEQLRADSAAWVDPVKKAQIIEALKKRKPKEVPAVVAPVIAPSVDTDTLRARNTQIIDRDTVTLYKYIPEIVKVASPDTAYYDPWEIDAFYAQRKVTSKRDVMYGHKQEGFGLRVTSATFGKRGTFGHNFSAMALVEKFNNVKDTSAIMDMTSARPELNGKDITFESSGWHGQVGVQFRPVIAIGGFKKLPNATDTTADGKPKKNKPSHFYFTPSVTIGADYEPRYKLNVLPTPWEPPGTPLYVIERSQQIEQDPLAAFVEVGAEFSYAFNPNRKVKEVKKLNKETGKNEVVKVNVTQPKTSVEAFVGGKATMTSRKEAHQNPFTNLDYNNKQVMNAQAPQLYFRAGVRITF